MHSTERRFVVGPSNTLFAMRVCEHFSTVTGHFTGRGSEMVNFPLSVRTQGQKSIVLMFSAVRYSGTVSVTL